MAESRISMDHLNELLPEIGMINLGSFTFADNHMRGDHNTHLGATGILVGNAGPNMWKVFSRSAEYSDGQPDPMNRWTRRMLETLSAEFGVTCIFPFDKPFWPFQRFLHSAAGLKPSPLGLYIHPEFGLWHALRGVLVLPPDQEFASQFKEKDLSADKQIQHPCDTCKEKPCLSACPVEAFSGTSLNVDRCFTHIDRKAEPDCLTIGCQARLACPVGIDHRYAEDQIRFHMQAYRY